MKKSLGLTFPEEVAKVSMKSGHFRKSHHDKSWEDLLIPNFDPEFDPGGVNAWRILVIFLICLVGFFVLFVRVFHLQLVKGSENRSLADSNRIQVKVIHAPRGVIFDRNSKVLAANEPGFRLVETTNSGTKTTLISRDEALKMEVDGDPRFANLEIDNIRSYPFKDKLAHVLGYVGEITKDELANPQYSGLKVGDKIGRGGVEQTYQKNLRGIDGGEIIEVNSKGEKLRTLRQIDPIPGQNLYLSIDSDLQNLVYNQLQTALQKSGSCCGAAVVSDPQTGEILAMVSLPSFDPTRLDLALTSPNSPILNRAIAGLYPPGSTFKIASALAGLESGKITPQTQYEDTGVLSLGPYQFANWYYSQYGKTEGSVNLEKALQRSNDIFFYQLGATIGENALADTARKLGLGKTTGVDLPGEVDGLIPTPDWKQKQVGEVWYPGDTLHMAIGQGYVLTTPLQILNMTDFVASNGHLIAPHLAVNLRDNFGNTTKQFKYPVQKTDFKSSDLNLVQAGLALVPQTGGTAWPFFTFPIPTSGKTGTAEFGNQNKTHAWYTGFAPSNGPKIAATVLVEGGGEGSNVSSPVVKEIFRWALSSDKNHLISDTTPQIATSSAKTLGE